MIISQVLNNNVVTSIIDGQEVIVMGKAIGFNSRKGSEINQSAVQKVYYLHANIVHNHQDIKDIIANTSVTYITLAEDIIEEISKLSGKKFDDIFPIFLADHMSLTIKRAKAGKYVENIMWAEIKRVYPQEYEYGKMVVRQINEQYQINLRRDEAAFLALHIVNGYIETKPFESINVVEDIRHITNLISDELDLDLAHDLYVNNRFTSHLNYLLQRIYRDEIIDEEIDITSFEFLKQSYKLETIVLYKVTEYIKKILKYDLNDLECQYLLLHLISLNGRKVK